MITEQSNHNIKPRKTVKISDAAIIWGAYTTLFWKTLLYKSWSETFLLFIRQYLRFNKAILASLFWSPFRFKAGSQTIGLISMIFAASFLLSYNSVHVPILLKPLATFCVPFSPFFKTQEELYQLLFVDIHSQFLLIYTGMFIVSACIHLIMIWLGKSNPSLTKRGNSWLVLGLSRLMPVNEFVICALVEPLIVVGIGFAAWKYAGDVHFLVFMILIALAETAQQLLDKSYQTHMQSILNA